MEIVGRQALGHEVPPQGRTEGRRPSTKKAYITLTKDSKTIEAFDNMAQ